jgi:hypothetical protein
MLAYLSHLLQPLDISCFAALKQVYNCLVEMKIDFGVNYIDKQEFLLLYQQAQAKALYKSNI